ncbi:winged helix-turn-helix domain-containing protein [Rhodococcus sp. NPDC057297]|uniref:winged helix-turn-helix domain-containing protein n=1 Tax=Rhodococcus sp. NPDC057297 TaxID=3346090 RepID=UPI00362814A1
MRATSQALLGDWLILILGENSGKVTKAQALAAMEGRFGHLLNAVDWQLQPSGKEVKWHNQTAWERNNLVKSGILAPVSESGRGVWRLTAKGRAHYDRIRSSFN